ncbi:HAD-IA family hydrolase [Yoonia ponticola]|uniref:HAD-IA family hydrolase n=1 Tax=Yoonia ponticola TaxID=1524255 RepID=UPI001617D16F
MKVAGLIFDKDGTLFDFDKTWGVITKTLIETESAHDPALRDKLAQVLGFDMKKSVFFPESIVIASTSHQVAEAILPYTIDRDLSALMDRMTAATASTPQVQVTDLKTFFDELKASGFALGIATNDAEGPARANLTAAGVTEVFDFIAGFDSGFGAKPAAGQLLGFCEQLKLKPQQCVMIGDSLHDLHAGRAAGMRCVGVLTGPASRRVLSPHADVILKSIAELPAWLDTL